MHLFKTSAAAPILGQIHSSNGLKETKFPELVGGAVPQALVWLCVLRTG